MPGFVDDGDLPADVGGVVGDLEGVADVLDSDVEDEVELVVRVRAARVLDLDLHFVRLNKVGVRRVVGLPVTLRDVDLVPASPIVIKIVEKAQTIADFAARAIVGTCFSLPGVLRVVPDVASSSRWASGGRH